MKQLTEMPSEGQFVAIWEYDKKIWSGTFKWGEEDGLFEYHTEEDHFTPISSTYLSWFSGGIFMVLGEENE